MFSRNDLYLLASAVPPVLACALFFSYAWGQYGLSWFCALFIILAAETRAQSGPRVERTAVFWAHLSSSVPFFVALSALAFFAQPLWLVILTAVTGLTAFYTGAVLWRRGLEARVLHLR